MILITELVGYFVVWNISGFFIIYMWVMGFHNPAEELTKHELIIYFILCPLLMFVYSLMNKDN